MAGLCPGAVVASEPGQGCGWEVALAGKEAARGPCGWVAGSEAKPGPAGGGWGSGGRSSLLLLLSLLWLDDSYCIAMSLANPSPLLEEGRDTNLKTPVLHNSGFGGQRPQGRTLRWKVYEMHGGGAHLGQNNVKEAAGQWGGGGGRCGQFHVRDPQAIGERAKDLAAIFCGERRTVGEGSQRDPLLLLLPWSTAGGPPEGHWGGGDRSPSSCRASFTQGPPSCQAGLCCTPLPPHTHTRQLPKEVKKLLVGKAEQKSIREAMLDQAHSPPSGQSPPGATRKSPPPGPGLQKPSSDTPPLPSGRGPSLATEGTLAWPSRLFRALWLEEFSRRIRRRRGGHQTTPPGQRGPRVLQGCCSGSIAHKRSSRGLPPPPPGCWGLRFRRPPPPSQRP